MQTNTLSIRGRTYTKFSFRSSTLRIRERTKGATTDKIRNIMGYVSKSLVPTAKESQVEIWYEEKHRRKNNRLEEI